MVGVPFGLIIRPTIFDISLKETYDPLLVEEDYLIEDILQRAFQSGTLERQNPAFDINFYDLTDKWLVTQLKPKD